MAWKATYVLGATDTEGDITIEVTAGYTDPAGNAGLSIALTPTTQNQLIVENSATNVLLDRTKPEVTLISIVSDNSDNTRAKAGDTVTLEFTSSEDLSSTVGNRKAPAQSGVKLAGQDATTVTAQSGDSSGTKWQATYVLTDNLQDGDLAIEVTAGYTDLAGNAGEVKHAAPNIDARLGEDNTYVRTLLITLTVHSTRSTSVILAECTYECCFAFISLLL